MKKLFLILCLLPSAICFAQTKSVTKTVPGNDVTESLNIPSGKTFTVKSGGTLDVTGATLVGFANDSNPLALINGTSSVNAQLYLADNGVWQLNSNINNSDAIADATRSAARVTITPDDADGGNVMRVAYAAANAANGWLDAVTLATLGNDGTLTLTGNMNAGLGSFTFITASGQIIGSQVRASAGGFIVQLDPTQRGITLINNSNGRTSHFALRDINADTVSYTHLRAHET
mgnify:CR=1 FL=1